MRLTQTSFTDVLKCNVFSRPFVTKIVLILCSFCYLAVESYYLYGRFNSHRFDLTLYYETARQIFLGKIPFKDFPLEYPPFALIPIIIPEILNRLYRTSFEMYTMWFVLQNLTFGFLTGIFIFKTAAAQRSVVLCKYIVLLTFALPIYLFRFDPFPAFLTCLVIYCHTRKPFLCGFIAMVSVAAKVYPIVFLPIILLLYLVNRQYRPLLQCLAGWLGVAIIIYLIYVFVAGNTLFDFLSYHNSRGIHLESLSGGILLLLDKVGVITLNVVHNFGAFHVVTKASQVILTSIMIATPLAFTAMGVLIFVAFKNRKHSDASLLINAFVLQLVLFLLLNKVFSPQYLVWLLPVIPFCSNRIFVIFAVTLVLTVFIFPGEYHYLIAKHISLVVC